MTDEDLKLFLDVAEQLSFAAVSEARDVAPSSISRPIARLERELGARLFERTTRRMTLTEAGALFRDRARLIVDEMEAAKSALYDRTAVPGGHLRMTASVAFGERLIAPLMAEFGQLYPGVSVEMIFTDANLDLIAESVDLGVRLAPRPSENLIMTRLMTTRYRVVASPRYVSSSEPLGSPEALADHDCLRLNFEPYLSDWHFRDQSGETRTVSVKGSILSSSALALRAAALTGAGPALLADWMVREDLARGDLVDLFEDFECSAGDFDTAAWLLFPSRSYLPTKTRVMIDFLKARVAR